MFPIHSVGFDPDFVPYAVGLDLQSKHIEQVSTDAGEGALLLLEHASVYTAGRRTRESDRPAGGTPVVDVDRGGRITWHGPGQLVGYPIVRLAKPRDLVGYVRALESMIINALGDVGVTGVRIEGRTGVWTGSPERPEKVAQIGVRVARGVTSHGFAINCTNDLAPFRAIVPCGISDAGVTTISRVTGTSITPTDLLPSLRARAKELYEEVAA